MSSLATAYRYSTVYQNHTLRKEDAAFVQFYVQEFVKGLIFIDIKLYFKFYKPV